MTIETLSRELGMTENEINATIIRDDIFMKYYINGRQDFTAYTGAKIFYLFNYGEYDRRSEAFKKLMHKLSIPFKKEIDKSEAKLSNRINQLNSQRAHLEQEVKYLSGQLSKARRNMIKVDKVLNRIS